VPDARAGFDPARPNRACDDGIEGPPTEPQTDGSRRTRLGARNGLQWAAHLDLLKILLPDRLDQLHSRGSEPSLYSRASSAHEPRARASHCLEPPRRRRPKPAAQRSAVLRTRLAACRAPCPAGKAPPNPARPLRKAAARRTSGTGSPGSPPQQQGTFRLDGPRYPASPRQPTKGSGPVYARPPRGNQRTAAGPCTAGRVRGPTRRPRPRQRADVGRDCSEPNPAARTSTESSLPVARTLPAEGILWAVKGTASLTSERILVHGAAHTPRDQQPRARTRLYLRSC
jgi:hypothetical protein